MTLSILSTTFFFHLNPYSLCPCLTTPWYHLWILYISSPTLSVSLSHPPSFALTPIHRTFVQTWRFKNIPKMFNFILFYNPLQHVYYLHVGKAIRHRCDHCWLCFIILDICLLCRLRQIVPQQLNLRLTCSRKPMQVVVVQRTHTKPWTTSCSSLVPSYIERWKGNLIKIQREATITCELPYEDEWMRNHFPAVQQKGVKSLIHTVSGCKTYRGWCDSGRISHGC